MRFAKLLGLVVSCFLSNIGIFLVNISSNSFLLHFHSIFFLELVSYILGSLRMPHMSLRLIFTPFICACLDAFCLLLKFTDLFFYSVHFTINLSNIFFILYIVLYFSVLVFLFYSTKKFHNLS